MNNPLNDKDTQHESYIKQQAKCLGSNLHNKKGFCTRVQECGVNLETARLKSLQKGQVLRPLIPIKHIQNKFR